MKTRRMFQLASAFFALIFAILLLCVAILAITTLVGTKPAQVGLIYNIAQGIRKIASTKSYLQVFGDTSEIVLVCTTFLPPALLLIFGASILLLELRKEESKHNLAGSLIVIGAIGGLMVILGTIAYTVTSEATNKFFSDKTAVAWLIAILVIAVILIALVLVYGISKARKTKEQSESQPPEIKFAEAPATEDEMPAEMTEATETLEEPVAEVAETETTEEPAPDTTATEEPEAEINEEPVPETPDVEDVDDGEKSEAEGDYLKKLPLLLFLLDENAITYEEYVQLVDAYTKKS